MQLRPILIILTLAATSILGCNRQSDAPADTSPTQSASATPESKIPAFTPINDAPTLTEDSLHAVEQKYSCQLPDDYRKFLLKNNGGFPSPDCVDFEEAGQKTASDVFCFFAIGDERAWASMEWHHNTYSGRLPKNMLPIARDSCGNLWLLCVGGEHAGSVFFWDHGSFDTFDETDLANWPRVATSFTKFRDNLRIFDAAAKNDVVPSRYALVKQTTERMAKKNDANFSTRANPEFVFLCHCDEDGDISMQFVRYKIHAAITHTCGYSRLRAIEGVIKEGQTRLPE